MAVRILLAVVLLLGVSIDGALFNVYQCNHKHVTFVQNQMRSSNEKMCSHRGKLRATTCNPSTILTGMRKRRSSQLKVSLNENWDALMQKVMASSDTVSSTTMTTTPNPTMQFVPTLPFSLGDKVSSFLDTIVSPTIPNIFPSFNEYLSNLNNINFGSIDGYNSWIDVVKVISNDAMTFYLTLPQWMEISIAVIPLVIIGISGLIALSYPDDDYRTNMEPYPRGEYDPNMARAYYVRHPVLVIQRLLQLFRLSYQFILSLLIDKYIYRNEEQQRSKRADELLQLITQLGPTAIKVGQALSVRPDLIPEEYAKSLSTLQDQVPPFDGSQAKLILQRELGMTRHNEIKVKNFNKPIASASIGQVYKGTIQVPATTMNDGVIVMDDDTNAINNYNNNNSGMTTTVTREVAIKVQRPNVLAEIALDLYVVREIIAPVYQKITRGATDLQSLANEWGRGFIAELDYRREATSTIRFNNEMAVRNLNAVCAPTVISKYSTERILMTEWVDGTRLDESDANDVPRLCAVALNAYLVMLLELKSLHCDPHPGNLLRTKDGKLCILDFGMTLDIDPNLQYSLLEFVAHLTSENYNELPEDLAALGFLKKDKVEYVRRTGLLEPLKFFLNQAGKGGGAKGVRDRVIGEFRAKYPGLSDEELRTEMRSQMKQQASEMAQKESVATGITTEVEDLQKRNRDSFQIPEWFLYSSRAFLTLEGVSLAADESYSLIKSCFPYVAKRLVADDDPRARKALKDLLYGASDSVDVNRLTDLADGFSSYTTTTKTFNQQAKAHDGEIILVSGEVERVSKEVERRRKMIDAEATMTLAKDSADVLLAPEGNLVQSLLVEEGALAASANVKDILRSRFVDGPRLFRESLPLGIGSFLPELPFESQVEPFLRKTMKEVRAQELADKLANVVQPPVASNGKVSDSNNDTGNAAAIKSAVDTLRGMEPEQAALVLKEIRENLPRYAPMVGRLGGKFMSTLLNTASSNIERTLNELEVAGESSDEAFLATARSMSAAAQRGAEAISSSTIVTDAPPQKRL